jgi:hypothetical protein
MFEVGQEVVLITDRPYYGSGGVKKGEVGLVHRIIGDNELLVLFPNTKDWKFTGWTGLIEEFIHHRRDPDWRI